MKTVECLRTPDACFDGLPGWPYTPRWVDDLPGYEGIRIHYVDEGTDRGGGTVLCLHGNPTWSYLYRSMIPVFVAAGMRVVAPDLIGFGRSDKPVDPSVHRFAWHRGMLLALVARLDLNNTLLVCQDWGGLLGLTLPMDVPLRFSRLLVMNTMLATGDNLTPGFLGWRRYTNQTPDMAVGRLMARGKPDMSTDEARAYDAPFPDAAHKLAIRAFANMVPDDPSLDGARLSARARDWWAGSFSGQAFMAIGQADPVLGEPVMRSLHASIRGCALPMLLPQAGHFVPEWGEPVARAALQHFGLATAAS